MYVGKCETNHVFLWHRRCVTKLEVRKVWRAGILTDVRVWLCMLQLLMKFGISDSGNAEKNLEVLLLWTFFWILRCLCFNFLQCKGNLRLCRMKAQVVFSHSFGSVLCSELYYLLLCSYTKCFMNKVFSYLDTESFLNET